MFYILIGIDSEMQKYKFFRNNFVSSKNVRTFAPDFERKMIC